MGFFDNDSIKDALNKAKEITRDATTKISGVTNDKINQVKERNAMKNMSREEALAI